MVSWRQCSCTQPVELLSLPVQSTGVGGDYEHRSLGLPKLSGTYVSLRAGPSTAAVLASTLRG